MVGYGAENTVTVKAKNFSGLGGIMDQPYVGAVLRPPDKADELAWRFVTGRGEDDAWTEPGFDDTEWQEVPVPDTDLRERTEANEGYVRYRLHFRLKPDLAGRRPVFDLGPVYDACEVFLNGERAAVYGRFPPQYIPVTTKRVRFIARPRNLKESNVLAVRLYRRLGLSQK